MRSGQRKSIDAKPILQKREEAFTHLNLLLCRMPRPATSLPESPEDAAVRARIGFFAGMISSKLTLGNADLKEGPLFQLASKKGLEIFIRRSLNL